MSLNRRSFGWTIALCLIAVATAPVLFQVSAERSQLGAAAGAASRRPTGEPQLVDVIPLGADGAMCQWQPASASTTLAAALQQQDEVIANRHSSTLDEEPGNADRPPVRAIGDTYPTYSAIALNLQKDEVLLQDENLFGIKVFNRLDDTPPTAAFTEPKRTIAGGGVTKLEFNCGLYVDPKTGDIYSITNDTIDTMTVFPWDAKGEMKPARELYTPHGTYSVSVDEDAQEIYLTVQHENSVVVYPKTAAGEDKPIRTLVGPKTQMEDPHGVAVDYKNNLMFVSNHGNALSAATDSGYFQPPSITVYPMKAQGDIAPLRIIEGPKTRLNWPSTMVVDSQRGELYVANDSDDSVVVFKATDKGDVAPTRMIRGVKTGLKNPTGLFIDFGHDELWVSNMGNHSATVFRRTANGDVAPLRTIRSAPLGKVALAIGNPGAVAWDSKRDEILVPNCVAHAQIASFPRTAKANTPPNRMLAGQKTLMARTMHDIRYDPIHDEFVVNNPFAYAVLVFRGGATGEEAPIRIIQGPKTKLGSSSRLEIDPVNNEILVPEGRGVLVFDREANGDVAPKRILNNAGSGGGIVVDAVHNLLILGSGGNNKNPGGIRIYNRTASGDEKPLRAIGGPKSGIVRALQMQVHPPTGIIAVTQPGESGTFEPGGTFVGFWHISDDGDVPPRWKLAGPKSRLIKPRGVAIVPSAKEVFVADMSLNSVLVYYFPEIF